MFEAKIADILEKTIFFPDIFFKTRIDLVQNRIFHFLSSFLKLKRKLRY